MQQSFYGQIRSEGYDIGTEQDEMINFYWHYETKGSKHRHGSFRMTSALQFDRKLSCNLSHLRLVLTRNWLCFAIFVRH